MMKRAWLGIAVAVLCFASSASAQEDGAIIRAAEPDRGLSDRPGASRGPREFGADDVSILNLGPCSLQPRGATQFTHVENPNCSFISPAIGFGNLIVGADVHLPAGVLITEVTIHYFDTHQTSNPAFALARVDSTGNIGSLFNMSLGDFDGGNNTVTIVLPVPETVDNLTYNYIFVSGLERSIADFSQNEGFYRAAIKYRRQVSPAPGAASFNDVPTTHPFFQFVEALVASGITVGCGSGNYCPDSSLTRGQMAVFLAKALGLHFPN